MSQTATITATTHKRDVKTEIMYWQHIDKPEEAEVDLRHPDGMKRMDALSRLDDARKVVVKDIRGEEKNYTLEKNGFQFVRQEVAGLKGLTDKDEMEKVLLPATEELVKKVTGATKTIIFTHRIRHKSVDENKLAESVAPAHGAHTDFTNESGLHSLETLIKDPVELAALLQKRVRIINVWRPLKTVRKDPLAVCDWNSVKLKDDLVNNKLIFPNGEWHTLGKLAWNEGQEWMYVNEQTPEEPLLFTQWDSAKTNDVEKKSTLPHTAFVDPEYIEDEARQSIEIKMWAFSDN